MAYDVYLIALGYDVDQKVTINALTLPKKCGYCLVILFWARTFSLLHYKANRLSLFAPLAISKYDGKRVKVMFPFKIIPWML